MKNKKGIIPVVLAFQIGFGLVGLACLWHIPAWSKAKDAHCEADYQAGKMSCGDKATK